MANGVDKVVIPGLDGNQYEIPVDELEKFRKRDAEKGRLPMTLLSDDGTVYEIPPGQLKKFSTGRSAGVLGPPGPPR